MQNRIINSSSSSTMPRTHEIIQGCSECGKFLPQCAICLQFMTITPSVLLTAYGAVNKQIINSNNINTSPKLSSTNNDLVDDNYTFLVNNKFGNLFSWCMNCKHGGHLKHLAEWFNIHSKCPFAHCKCTCLLLDVI